MRKHGIRLILLMVILQLCLGGDPASAGSNKTEDTTQPGLPGAPSISAPVGPPIDIRSKDNRIEYATTAFNSKRAEYLVIWNELNDVGFGTSIYGRRVDIYGNSLSTAFPIMSITDKYFRQADVVYVPKHDKYWIAIYEDASFKNTIWVKSIDWKGETISQNVLKESTDSPGFPSLAAAYNSQDDQVLIVYEDGTSSTNRVIGAACLNAKTGTSCGENDISASSKRLRFPDTVYNPARNEYLIAYEVFGGVGDGNIKGKVCKSDLSTCSVEIPITVHGHPAQECVSLAVGPDEYLTAWHETYNDGTNRIWGRRIGGDGTLHSFAALTPISENYDCPKVAYGDSDRYLVVLHDYKDVFGRFVAAGEDEPEGTEFLIEKSSDNPGNQAAACGLNTPCLAVYSTLDAQLKEINLRGRFVGYWKRNHLPVIYR